MAIEDALNRLASAVERNQSGSAVAEIIRQRDYWQKAHGDVTRSRDWYEKRWEEEVESGRRMGRTISSLRGVITRMKRKKDY